MSAAHPPEKHNDALVLQEILSLVAQSIARYNTIAREVCYHRDQMAKERAALGALRTRLIGMRTQPNVWDERVWDIGYRREFSQEVREHVKANIRTHERALDGLIWQLFDFRDNQR